MATNVKAKAAPKRRDSIPMAEFSQPLAEARRTAQSNAEKKLLKEAKGEEVVEGEEVRETKDTHRKHTSYCDVAKHCTTIFAFVRFAHCNYYP